MTFERTFRVISYAAVLCGFGALWISGTFGPVATLLFLLVLIAGWNLEGSKWQIGEKTGTALIVAALPFYYLAWRYQVIDLYGAETAVAGILARMILSLTAIKLLQNKSDRDWIFLYLMSFFEVLLAAGLSISPLYLLTFIVYLLLMVAAIVAFEVRVTGRSIGVKLGRKNLPLPVSIPHRRLPATAVVLLVFVVLLAVPLFFLLPRVGGAGFGGMQGGSSTSAGFSDVVKLGNIGTIQQTDEVVMRVQLEGPVQAGGLYFRGVGLDTFDGRSWSKSRGAIKEPFVKGDRDFIQVDAIANREKLVVQTIYLEPLDVPFIFALPKVVAIQGSFPIIEKDAYGALSYRRTYERITYTALSDPTLPDAAVLRRDNQAYTAEMSNYLQLPDKYDRRIFELAYSIASKERSRYDRALGIERYLQSNLGYTLEQKAQGEEPLADFLFNVKEGHCEYFATAMAVMLRTQGIASRVVNGFHGGDYNDASDMTVVRQRNAHSWVEVYFPETGVWVPFDPTPAINDSGSGSSGITAQFNKYSEAFEAFWIQHFVTYDNQGQRSLLRSVREGIVGSEQNFLDYFKHAMALLEEWWADVQGQNGAAASWSAIGWALLYIVSGAFILGLLGWLVRRVVKSKVWERLRGRAHAHSGRSVIEFYERMQAILADKGLVRLPHQTPLEFAYATEIPPVIRLTERYQRIRFGEAEIDAKEQEEIQRWLQELETPDAQSI